MNQIGIGNRIVILGCPGSGKSTFAKRLHAYTGLPLIHLDRVWWKEDRTHISREEFDRRLESLLQGDAWILDGNYNRTNELRIQACDTVFFLDFPEDVCMQGIVNRVGQRRSDIPFVEEQLDPELVKLVQNYRTDNRPRVYSLLKKYPETHAIIFKSREQLDRWASERFGASHE